MKSGVAGVKGALRDVQEEIDAFDAKSIELGYIDPNECRHMLRSVSHILGHKSVEQSLKNPEAWYAIACEIYGFMGDEREVSSVPMASIRDLRHVVAESMVRLCMYVPDPPKARDLVDEGKVTEGIHL